MRTLEEIAKLQKGGKRKWTADLIKHILPMWEEGILIPKLPAE